MSRTILLADDSVTIRKVVELTFLDEDYELIAVEDGAQALAKLEEIDPDLVIADVHMPEADGFAVCKAAKAKSASIPVLLLVGTFESFEPEQAAAVGADDFLKKPFDSQILLRHVGDLLQGSSATSSVAAAEGVAEAQVSQSPSPEIQAPVDEVAQEAAVASEDEPEPQPEESAGTEADDQLVEKVARRVVELLGPNAVQDVAWEVVPDLAEVVIKERLRELESQVE